MRVREIEACKLAVVFLRSLVVGFGGVDFVCEAAEIDVFAVGSYVGLPCRPACASSEENSLVYRRGLAAEPLSVGHVLGVGGFSDVCGSIVDAISIDVVDETVVAGVDKLSVHSYDGVFG